MSLQSSKLFESSFSTFHCKFSLMVMKRQLKLRSLKPLKVNRSFKSCLAGNAYAKEFVFGLQCKEDEQNNTIHHNHFTSLFLSINYVQLLFFLSDRRILGKSIDFVNFNISSRWRNVSRQNSVRFQILCTLKLRCWVRKRFR